MRIGICEQTQGKIFKVKLWSKLVKGEIIATFCGVGIRITVTFTMRVFNPIQQAFQQSTLASLRGRRKNGRGGGGRKVRKQGKGKGALSPQSHSFFPSSLSPTPFDACYVG